MKEPNFEVTSNMAIEIMRFNCPACEKVVFEMLDHEVEQCVHCGQEFHGEIERDYEPDKYFLLVNPKTGKPRIYEDPEA
ncbi:hypothetical protein SD70_32460 [Gordoniibacillus kamchatkensis]|uniref:Uncharacterized protein n=1 Tax=Gordoniibacillus kamchatkensis TaxID=1590651 RepID=A0ABR5A0S8_9BACL|nr:hypothetical protein [Paenibacillus sp. VKM B-2647]KIL34667.1 hypothetical protein SD70_32460 [Paenibacillus sp. VKM B-2647]